MMTALSPTTDTACASVNKGTHAVSQTGFFQCLFIPSMSVLTLTRTATCNTLCLALWCPEKMIIILDTLQNGPPTKSGKIIQTTNEEG